MERETPTCVVGKILDGALLTMGRRCDRYVPIHRRDGEQMTTHHVGRIARGFTRVDRRHAPYTNTYLSLRSVDRTAPYTEWVIGSLWSAHLGSVAHAVHCGGQRRLR